MALGSTFSQLHQRLPNRLFNEAAISLRLFEKSVLEENLFHGLFEIILGTLESGMAFRLSVNWP